MSTPDQSSDPYLQTLKLFAFIDHMASRDPDRTIRLIESILARIALRKRLAERKAAMLSDQGINNESGS